MTNEISSEGRYHEINKRWNHLVFLDDELLKGGVILSEWCSVIVRETDIAFANGAYLASILTALSGIETYLRSEYGSKKMKLYNLINESPIEEDLKHEIHCLRKYRNNWVHVNDPLDDEGLLENPTEYETELEEMAYFAVKVLRKTIYENPWI